MSQHTSYSLSVKTGADDDDWDQFVDTHADGTPYHKSYWMHAVQRSYGHQQQGLILRDLGTGSIAAVLPVIEMATPLMGTSSVALPYCDTGAILARDETASDALLKLALDHCSQRNSKKVQIRGSYQNDAAPADLQGLKVRMLLTLQDSADQQMAWFKSKLRSQIRKAEKNGLRVETGVSDTLLDDFYRVYCINMRDLGSPVHHINWFRAIKAEYRDHCLISVVYLDDKAIGAGIILKNSLTASIPWASTIQQYNRLAPNMLLYWSVLSHCADTGIKTFDFGRSTYEEGTYKFKKQWGASPQALNWQDYQNGALIEERSDRASNTGNLRAQLESLWRKLPLSVTVKLGAAIRPYISL